MYVEISSDNQFVKCGGSDRKEGGESRKEEKGLEKEEEEEGWSILRIDTSHCGNLRAREDTSKEKNLGSEQGICCLLYTSPSPRDS